MVKIPGRFKRIESAFNVAGARAHPACDNSSGSDHSPEDTCDLSDLVASYIERDGHVSPDEEMDSSDNEDVKDKLTKLLEGLSGGEERMRIKAATEVAGKFVGDITPKRQLI